MGKIKKLLDNNLIGGNTTEDIYPITSTKAVYNTDNVSLDDIINKGLLINVSSDYKGSTVNPITLSEAIDLIPEGKRLSGQIIYFLEESTTDVEVWAIYQFCGSPTATWKCPYDWKRLATTDTLKESNEIALNKVIDKYNIVDNAIITEGYYLQDGVIYPNNDGINGAITDLIPLKPNTEYKIVDILPAYKKTIYVYRDNKVYLPLDPTEEIPIIEKDRQFYIRIGWKLGANNIVDDLKKSIVICPKTIYDTIPSKDKTNYEAYIGKYKLDESVYSNTLAVIKMEETIKNLTDRVAKLESGGSSGGEKEYGSLFGGVIAPNKLSVTKLDRYKYYLLSYSQYYPESITDTTGYTEYFTDYEGSELSNPYGPTLMYFNGTNWIIDTSAACRLRLYDNSRVPSEFEGDAVLAIHNNNIEANMSTGDMGYIPIVYGGISTYGTSAKRPTQAELKSQYKAGIGFCYYDMTLKKPIWWNGSAWYDSSGTAV